MTDKEKIEHMFQLQEELNTKIRGKDWRTQKLAWHRAIWTECAELVESLDWKWWKESHTDIMNCHVELIDIWHFGMSHILQNFPSQEHIIEYPDFIQTATVLYKEEILQRIEELVFQCIGENHFDCELFFFICFHLNLTLDKLYKLYIGKQVLNRFRNDNGYNNGSYNKIWNDQEDNVYMYNFIMNEKKVTEDSIYEYLEVSYEVEGSRA